MNEISFFEYLSSVDLKSLQRREVLLDFYSSGYLGMLVPCVLVASLTVFFLALFQIIPKRRHIVAILLALGILATTVGMTSSYLNFATLPARRAEIVREVSNEPPPPGSGAEAAVVALPVILGGLTLAGNLTGCLYLALFWGAQALPGTKKS